MVQQAAEGTGHEDVDGRLQRVLGGDPLGAELVCEPALGDVDVGQQQLRAAARARRGDAGPDVAEPCHGDRASGE